ncbi:MAG: TlpA family protein disulfide reductase [Bacteroidetes bacterium]|nr:TlpA family protein disulfide reductase [Bacteroidota bacterium]
MNRLILLAVWLVLSMAAFAGPGNKTVKNIPTLTFEAFEPLLRQQNDTVYVVNFWATWCAPCVKELPDFERLNQKYHRNKFRMILVSLDFNRQKESRLLPFVEQHKLKAEVIHLNAPDANAWIAKVNPDWSGAIPATLIYKGNRQVFREGSYTFEELDQVVKQLITK